MTRPVKVPASTRALARAVRARYNRGVQTPRNVNENRSLLRITARFDRRVVGPIAAVMSIGLLAGASCKKDTGSPHADPKDVVAAADKAKGSGSGTGTTGSSAPVDRTPVPGFDVAALTPDQQTLFFKMVDELPSPCGKAHSLRTSNAQDASCKRAPFAVKLVHDLIVDDQRDETVRSFYEERYIKNNKVWNINLVDAPMVGDPNAPVTLVEFFDYGCPACVALKPVLDRVIAENKGKLKVYYKMYPLVSKHPDSFGCAQAAFAARAQGKFHEMHDRIFEKFGNQKKEDLRRYAGDLGLDLGKYDVAFAAFEPRVKADMKDGEAVEVGGTPSLFLNGRVFGGPVDPKYMAAAIEEEIAVMKASAPEAPATGSAPAPGSAAGTGSAAAPK